MKNKILALCSLLFALCLTSLTANADVEQQDDYLSDFYNLDATTLGIHPKEFILDTVLWSNTYNATTSTYEIPVCWDSPVTAAQKTLAQQAVAGAWEFYSRVKFMGWGVCTTISPGIRITINNNATTPRAALGTQGKNVKGVMELDFSLSFSSVPAAGSSIYEKCQSNFPNISLDTCIKSTIIHEFGHVLGFAHEQNRGENTSIAYTCHEKDPNPKEIPGIVGSFATFGNTVFTDFDDDSVMNYCRSNYLGRTDTSLLDKMALRVYYGNMPSFDSRTLLLKIHRLIISATGQAWTATLAYGTDGKFRIISNGINLTNTLSNSTAYYSSTGEITLPELSFVNGSGHVNQVLTAKLQLENPSVSGVYLLTSWIKLQPTIKAPSLAQTQLNQTQVNQLQ